MKKMPWQAISAALFVSMTCMSTAHAQWAVIDAPATLQLIQEVEDMEQIISTARSQLTQAKQALSTMTGDRGMEWLLSGTTRNYLPSTWSQYSTAALGGSNGLGGDVQGNITANAILSPARLATLSSGTQQLVQAARQWGAMRQTISHEALANASNRFSSLQTLITQIGSSADQKSILDLQARINAELGMLQNEQTKLQVLNQATLAQESVLQQQALEMTIQNRGRFETRFQPTP